MDEALKTLDELIQIHKELSDYLHWLLERKDFAAFEKLSPTVKRLLDILMGIVKGNIPAAGPLFEVFNKVEDNVKEMLAQGIAPEALGPLSKALDDLVTQFQEVVAEALQRETHPRA